MINDSKLNINTNQKLLNEIFDLVKDANEKKNTNIRAGKRYNIQYIRCSNTNN